MAEPDAPKNRLIIALVVGTISSLIAVVLMVAQYFGMTVREEVFKKELTVKPVARRELEQREEHLLNSYKWVSQKEGKVRIPVKQAEDLVLKEWNDRPTGLAPSADLTTPPPAAPAPAPAPAPGGAAPPRAAPPSAAPGPPRRRLRRRRPRRRPHPVSREARHRSDRHEARPLGQLAPHQRDGGGAARPESAPAGGGREQAAPGAQRDRHRGPSRRPDAG